MADTITKTVVIKVEENTLSAVKSQQALEKAKLKNAAASKKQLTATQKYSGALKDLTAELGILPAGFTALQSGVSGAVKSLKVFKTALAATGIGFIVLALGALFAWFTKTKEGSEKLSVAMAFLGEIFDSAIETLAAYGKLLFSIFTFDLDGVKESVKEMGEAWEGVLDQAEKAAEIAKARLVLQKEETANIKKQAQALSDIADARLISDDNSKSAAERQEALAIAEEKSKEVINEKIRLQTQRIKLLKEEQTLSKEGVGDGKELALLEKGLIDLNRERSDKLRELLGVQDSIRAAVKADIAAQKQLNAEEAKRVQALVDAENKKLEADAAAQGRLEEFRLAQREAAAQQIEDADLKAQELIIIETERYERQRELGFEFRADSIIAEEAHQAQLLQIQVNADEQNEKLRQERIKKIEESDKKVAADKIKLDKKLEDQKKKQFDDAVTNLDALANLTTAALGAAFGENKNAAIGAALINTALGVTKTIGQLGFPAAIPAIAALAIAAGVQIDTIQKQTFARGGMLSGSLHSQGGIQIEAEHGEAVINRRSMANPVLRGLASQINEMGGGIPFAARGFISGSTDAQFGRLGSDIQNGINSQVPVLVTEDLDAVQNRVAVTEAISTL